MIIAIAPGGPGSRPTWTSSAKDMVTTALGTSRVWVTLGYGILNEVYWPATGLPQIRDLGFIVAGSSEWFEVKRVNRYHVSMPDDWVPLPQVAHEGDGYRLLIEVLPDPSRDVVLILYRLTGDNMNLYALLAPARVVGNESNIALEVDLVVVAAQDRPLDHFASDGIVDTFFYVACLRRLALAGRSRSRTPLTLDRSSQCSSRHPSLPCRTAYNSKSYSVAARLAMRR